MSDNRNFDGPSAGERGRKDWTGLMLGNRMSDLANRRNNMSELKKVQGSLLEKASTYAQSQPSVAKGLLEQADRMGQFSETLVPTYVDAQGQRRAGESVQDPNEMWSPTQRRLQNNADYNAAFERKQAAGYIDPITAANRENAKNLDSMLKIKAPSYDWNGKTYTHDELSKVRQGINTKSMQEQYDEQAASREGEMEDPNNEFAKEARESFKKRAEGLKQIANETQYELANTGMMQKDIDAEIRRRQTEAKPIYDQIHQQNVALTRAKWMQDRKRTMQDWLNNKLIPEYEGYVPEATERGSDRNNLPTFGG
jgi:hypothetical protein